MTSDPCSACLSDGGPHDGPYPALWCTHRETTMHVLLQWKESLNRRKMARAVELMLEKPGDYARMKSAAIYKCEVFIRKYTLLVLKNVRYSLAHWTFIFLQIIGLVRPSWRHLHLFWSVMEKDSKLEIITVQDIVVSTPSFTSYTFLLLTLC